MAQLTTTISYGEAGATNITANCITTIGPDEARFPAVTDPASAVREAIAHPLDFPSLDNATVPGDRVAVVMDPVTPSPGSVMLGAIAALCDAGVEPDHVVVVSALASQADCLREVLAQSNFTEVQLELHDAEGDEACAMVAVTKSGEALRFNRAIAEADFILPVTTSRASQPDGKPRSPFESLYPVFADGAAQQGWRRSTPAARRNQVRQRLAEVADEAGWLLGACFVVQLVPSAGGGIAGVYAGEPRVATQSALQRRAEVWSRPIPEPADLVIATIRGGSQEHSWSNLGRALEVAEYVAASEGAVVLCCDLVSAPGKLLRNLAGEVDLASVERLASSDYSDEGPVALALCRALQRGPVFLRSRLDDAMVERTGMTPITSDAELDRLASRRRRCVVIEDAHRVELDAQLSSA